MMLGQLRMRDFYGFARPPGPLAEIGRTGEQPDVPSRRLEIGSPAAPEVDIETLAERFRDMSYPDLQALAFSAFMAELKGWWRKRRGRS